MSKNPPAIILSSGHSKRLGQPKSLVEINGKTLLSLAVDKLILAGCSPVVVVVNKAIQFESLMNSNGAIVVVNKNPENGRTGSLKVGINSIISDIGRIPKSIIMAPVDRPGWKSSHISELINTKNSSCLWQNGQKGHPVKLVKNDLLKIINSPDEAPLRDLVTFDKTEVSDAILSLNIDTPDDLIELSNYSEYFNEL